MQNKLVAPIVFLTLCLTFLHALDTGSSTTDARPIASLKNKQHDAKQQQQQPRMNHKSKHRQAFGVAVPKEGEPTVKATIMKKGDKMTNLDLGDDDVAGQEKNKTEVKTITKQEAKVDKKEADSVSKVSTVDPVCKVPTVVEEEPPKAQESNNSNVIILDTKNKGAHSEQENQITHPEKENQITQPEKENIVLLPRRCKPPRNNAICIPYNPHLDCFFAGTWVGSEPRAPSCCPVQRKPCPRPPRCPPRCNPGCNDPCYANYGCAPCAPNACYTPFPYANSATAENNSSEYNSYNSGYDGLLEKRSGQSKNVDDNAEMGGFPFERDHRRTNLNQPPKKSDKLTGVAADSSSPAQKRPFHRQHKAVNSTSEQEEYDGIKYYYGHEQTNMNMDIEYLQK